MKYDDFTNLYNQLNKSSDIKDLSCKTGLDEELLYVIYTQRITRETTRAYYKVDRYVKDMIRDWHKGMSLLEISEKAEFPPIMTGLLMFKEMGKGKKEFWSYVRQPEIIASARLKREIIEITEADFVYSPWANEKQKLRGIWGENNLQCWLQDQGITFRTEKDIRGEFTKTPDCLLDKPIRVNGWDINWIESKATFGDRVEVNKNLKKQLAPYREMFGKGIVVYWFGYVDDVELPEGVNIIDASLTNLTCKYVE
ncbi:MAG: C15orf41 family protein [Methanomassiliicoccales archaeon]|jgi:hypothetical protein